MLNIPQFSEEELLSSLKPFQNQAISQLLASNSIEETISIWLTSSGPSNTSRFGGIGNKPNKTLYENIKVEFRKFICGSPEYEDYRQKIAEHENITSLLLVSTIASALSSTLGVISASLLSPVITLLLISVCKIGQNAWCNFES